MTIKQYGIYFVHGDWHVKIDASQGMSIKAAVLLAQNKNDSEVARKRYTRYLQHYIISGDERAHANCLWWFVRYCELSGD